MAKKYTSLLKSASYALKGLATFWDAEFKSKIHLAMAVIVTVAGVCFDISRLDWIAQVICIFVVLSAEIINTSIEEIVDFVSPEQKKAAGRIKDLAAAAVLVATVGAVIVGILIYFPHLTQRFSDL